MTHKWDCIIVGGGLAGSMAGILFRRKGWRVLILEKAQYPRHKVCGEFLSPAIWPLLDQVGLATPLKLKQGKEVDSVTLFSPGQNPLHAKLPFPSKEHPYAYGISRKTLDDFLLQEAEKRGCIVFQNHEVKSIQKNKETSDFKIEAYDNKSGKEISFHASIVIDATGKQNISLPRRQAGQRTFGFKAHFKNIPLENKTELFFFKKGYLGMIEIEEGLTNVCGKVEETWLKKHGRNFDLLLKNAGDQNPNLGVRLKKAQRQMEWISCGPLKEGFKRAYEDGIFYAGDSACFVEPFLGQGMTMAISSAFLLNSTLKQIPSTQQKLNALGKSYEKQLRKFYRSKLTTGRFFNPFAFSPVLGSILTKIFFLFPALLDGMLKTACEVKIPCGDEGNPEGNGLDNRG